MKYQNLQYNLLNLPSRITYQDGRMINYIYSATGTKLSVTYTNGGTTTNNQYCGNMLYENGTLKQILIDGGYITFNGSTPQYHFYLKDHLGNNRVVLNANGGIEQVNHYYSFGGLMGESTNGDVQTYKYNGKELDRMNGLDWYDYGARHMDGIRFTTIDPMAEKYYGVSPYVYCANNPVRFIDPDGRDGMITGQGTKDDPYIVTAIYYYQKGLLGEGQISGLNAAISDYNKLGGKNGFVVEMDGAKSYVKFNLKVQEVDNPEEARAGTCFETADGNPRYYGNIVGTKVDTGEEYGSANNIRIDFNVSNINEGISQGLSGLSLNRGGCFT